VVSEGLQGGTPVGLPTAFHKKLYAQFVLLLLLTRFCEYIPSFLCACLIGFEKWTLYFLIAILHMSLLCQVSFSKLLIEWYLVECVFLEQSGTWWQHVPHNWYAIRKSLGNTDV